MINDVRCMYSYVVIHINNTHGQPVSPHQFITYLNLKLGDTYLKAHDDAYKCQMI